MQCPTLSLGQSFIITSNVYEYEHSCRNKRKDVLLVYCTYISVLLYFQMIMNMRTAVEIRERMYNYTYTYIYQFYTVLSLARITGIYELSYRLLQNIARIHI